MKTEKRYLVFFLFFLQGIHVFAQETESHSFFSAFDSLKAMLEEKQPVDFERAVFISENAFHNNKYFYTDFQQSIDQHLYLIKGLIAANDHSDTMDFSIKVNANGRFNVKDIRFTEKEKKELYRKVLANWAIFTYMNDTTSVYPFYHLPFNYSTSDPFGMKDWSNSQVLNLLASEEQQGNCFALTGFFKIMADRLQTGAHICTAPQHIYIQHQDHKGDYYNVELATAGHPGDGLIQTLTYTTSKAIENGIALRRYDDKQSIGLCLINLAKGYEHKFKTKADDFILQCAELALKYDSLSLNALLLKQQVWEERVMKYAKEKNISEITDLKKDKAISKTVFELEKHLSKLNSLGYLQMPMDMQEIVLNGFKKEETGAMLNKNPSPFTTIKPKDEEDESYWTLSHGLFQEVFEPKKLENYGHFVFDTETKIIATIDTSNENEFLIDPVAFAYDFGARIYDPRIGKFLSVDILTRNFPFYTPYQCAGNNPIKFIDIDGMEPGPNKGDHNPQIKSFNYTESVSHYTGLDIKKPNSSGSKDEQVAEVMRYMQEKQRAKTNLQNAQKIIDETNSYMSMFPLAGSVGIFIGTASNNDATAVAIASAGFWASIDLFSLGEGSQMQSGLKLILGKSHIISSYANKIENSVSMFKQGFGLGIPSFLAPSNQIMEAMYKTVSTGGKIVFDITDVSLDAAKQGFKNFNEAEEAGKITEWELSNILRDEKLFNSTIFHSNGKSQSAAELGLKKIE